MLVAAGIAGGLIGSIAGLASIATYPALLALGLAPVTANVTNTVALVFATTGAVSASRPELRGQGKALRRLAVAGILGGAAGGTLLLATPSGSFELAVPWLVAIGSVSMLARRRLVRTPVRGAHHHGLGLLAGTALVGVYGGYFGAGAGVMLLALLLHATEWDLPRANAIKNVVLGLANSVAAIAFALFGPVRWSAALPLGVGLFAGGRLGPAIVRRAPADGLRVAIAIAGLGLALKLGLDAYR
jgi:uncharacterized membrane protein YfcA